MELKEVFARRRSIRSYTDQAVTDEQLKDLILAANASPVGRARYETLHITVVRNKELLRAIEKDIASKFDNGRGSFLYNAPVLIIVSTTGNDNLAYSNCAIVVQDMALAAINAGLGACHNWCCAMALATNEELKQQLAIPTTFVPACALVLGNTLKGLEPRSIPDKRISLNFV